MLNSVKHSILLYEIKHKSKFKFNYFTKETLTLSSHFYAPIEYCYIDIIIKEYS